MSPPLPTSHETARRSVVREVALVFLASAALTALIVLVGDVVPFIGQNALALVAVVFIYLPVVALRRRGLDPAHYGLEWRRLTKGARTGLVVTLIAVPPFLVGFHIWETVAFDHRFKPAFDNYYAFADELRIEPPSTQSNGVYVWRQQRSLILRWVGDGPWRIEIGGDCDLARRSGAQARPVSTESGDRWVIETTAGTHDLALWARGGRRVTIAAWESAEPLTPDDFWLAGQFGRAEHTPIELNRSLSWIPLSILIQLLLVALPEELFYRGYMQSRLQSLGDTRWHLGPLHTSPAILVTSALFALGHFIIGFDVQRLAVFFPSLVFGWLRDRTGGLGASIVFHAAANLMVELTVVHYWPI